MIATPKKEVASTATPVDCTNDAQMVREGLRVKPLIYDAEWHRKTPEERYYLDRQVKIKGVRVSSAHAPLRSVKHRITVHLTNQEKNPKLKTTYSSLLYEDQITEYMGVFFGHCRNKVKIVYYNGKNVTAKYI